VLAKCKKGVKIINCARGGTIDEADLVDALNSGQCGGAGFDVFVEEPPKNRALIEHPKVVGTPHLGASTLEAQVRVAEEIAEQIVQLNEGKALLGAINAQAVSCVLDKCSANIVKAVENLTTVVFALGGGSAKRVVVEAPEYAKKMEMALKAAVMMGILKRSQTTRMNLVNALSVGKAAGVEVEVSFATGDHCGSFVVKANSCSARGFPSPCGTILCGVGNDTFPFGVPLSKDVVFFEGSADAFADVRKNNLSGHASMVSSSENEKRHVALYAHMEKISETASKHVCVAHFQE